MAGLDALLEALRGPTDRRPEPAQMLWADRKARVVGYRRGPEGRSLFTLEHAPGLWPEEWLEAV